MLIATNVYAYIDLDCRCFWKLPLSLLKTYFTWAKGHSQLNNCWSQSTRLKGGILVSGPWSNVLHWTVPQQLCFSCIISHILWPSVGLLGIPEAPDWVSKAPRCSQFVAPVMGIQNRLNLFDTLTPTPSRLPSPQNSPILGSSWCSLFCWWGLGGPSF